jgi:adenylate cyclase
MDAPSRPDIERQLRLVLASAEFESSPKLSELIYYLVTETLAGNADRLKGYTIGIDVFNRQADFDQGVDAIVRVQMGRLRKLMKSYYAGSGASDPIRIHLVAGRYAPRFELATGEELSDETLTPYSAAPPSPVSAEPPPTAPPTPPPILQSRRGKALLLAAGLLVISGLAMTALYVVQRQGDARLVTAGEMVSGPLVWVTRYQVLSKDERERQLAEGLQFDLVNQLAKFPDMAVLAIDQDNDPKAKKYSRAADFRLTGAIEADGTALRVTSQLRRERDGLVIWSDQWLSDHADSRSVIQLQTTIATTVATKIGQTYGVIPQAMFEDISLGLKPGDSEYACILSTYTYMRFKTETRHGEARDCLEQSIQKSPRHALAWALLSWIYGDEERYGFNRKPDAIARALRSAERGTAADSHNAVAYEHLAQTRFLTGTDDVSAREAIETALRLQPNNSEVLADASWLLVLLGDTERGYRLGLQAIDLNPGHPAWYWTGPTFHALLTGDKANALKYARLNISDRGPIDIYLFAAALRLNGQAAVADEELRKLQVTHPNIGDRAHMMKVLRFPPQLEAMIFGQGSKPAVR